MTHKADVIVVGGGVIGASVAYQLARRGRKVILVEKGDLASGASGSCDTSIFLQSKNAGIHLRLALASAEIFKGLREELGRDIEYHVKGGMILIETADELKVMEDFAFTKELPSEPSYKKLDTAPRVGYRKTRLLINCFDS